MAKKKSRAEGKDLRDIGVMSAAASGKTQTDIAEEFDISRRSVRTILKSDEAKRLVDQSRAILLGYAEEAVQTLVDAMADRHSEQKGAMSTAVQAATTLLKGIGALTEKSEVTVLKPFVMKLIDGGEIVMGHKPMEEE